MSSIINININLMGYIVLEVRSVLVIGHGGCRMDFVAGWLGKLNGFVDTGWYVDPYTGESYGHRTTKMIDSTGANVQDELLKFGFKLTDNAELLLASGCHGFYLNNQLTGCNPNNLRIIRINFTNDDINQICWDFLIKTFLGSPQTITAVQTRIQEHVFYMNLRPIIDVDFPTIDVEYQQLLSIDGARFIAEKLGLTPSIEEYQLWEDALPLAISPEEIELHGHLWRKQDFF